jgi:cyclopropane fatty-acyl-phospholipid synthase-like methyltransferase
MRAFHKRGQKRNRIVSFPNATETVIRCAANPYDELNYRCLPVEWTAPERLVLASALHGGPRPALDSYRVLELGCGDGANLLPLAYYRRHATFVGVDGASSQISRANARKATLALKNIHFVHEEFSRANERLTGQFDFIVAHGIFSWLSDSVRDALFELCAERLQPGGLLYLNYNTKPGWNVRGMVREFLLAQTAAIIDLMTRAQCAKEVSAKIATSLRADPHPYSQLLANEFRFVCEHHVSYVAHEYLALENHAYWRSEFMSLAARFGFEFVADADFSYESGRTPDDLLARLDKEQITGRTLNDTADLLSYRQLHTPILAKAPLIRRMLTMEEFAGLRIASCLVPCIPSNVDRAMFQHPNGYQVEAKEDVMQFALKRLLPLWPRSLVIGELFPGLAQVRDDLELLHRNGLIELRYIEPGESGVFPDCLNKFEASLGGYVTTAYHTRERPVGSSDAALGTMESCLEGVA